MGVMRIPTHGPPTHPGEMLLREFVEPLHLTAPQLADEMDEALEALEALLQYQAGVTPLLAEKLQRRFGMDAVFWRNLQAVWDAYHTRETAAPSTTYRGQA